MSQKEKPERTATAAELAAESARFEQVRQAAARQAPLARLIEEQPPPRLDGSVPAEQHCYLCDASSFTVLMDPVIRSNHGVAEYRFACRGRDCGAGKRPPVTHTLERIREAVTPA